MDDRGAGLDAGRIRGLVGKMPGVARQKDIYAMRMSVQGCGSLYTTNAQVSVIVCNATDQQGGGTARVKCG
jgi:hypothetical protein